MAKWPNGRAGKDVCRNNLDCPANPDDDGDDDDEEEEEYDDYDDDEEDDGVFPARVSPQEGLGAPRFPRGGAVRLRAPVTPQVPGV